MRGVVTIVLDGETGMACATMWAWLGGAGGDGERNLRRGLLVDSAPAEPRPQSIASTCRTRPLYPLSI